MPQLFVNLPLPTPAVPVAAGVRLRASASADAAALARLYFAAYPPGVACATLEEAEADIAATFAGEYGPLWPAASVLAVEGGDLVAAVLTVRRANWENAPDCPYIIEVFSDPARRRQGLARAALVAALQALAAAGESRAGLSVDAENAPAVALYGSLGFRAKGGTA